MHTASGLKHPERSPSGYVPLLVDAVLGTPPPPPATAIVFKVFPPILVFSSTVFAWYNGCLCSQVHSSKGTSHLVLPFAQALGSNLLSLCRPPRGTRHAPAEAGPGGLHHRDPHSVNALPLQRAVDGTKHQERYARGRNRETQEPPFPKGCPRCAPGGASSNAAGPGGLHNRGPHSVNSFPLQRAVDSTKHPKRYAQGRHHETQEPHFLEGCPCFVPGGGGCNATGCAVDGLRGAG